MELGGPLDVRVEGGPPPADGAFDALGPGPDGSIARADAGDAGPDASFCDTITPTPTPCDDFERNDPKGALVRGRGVRRPARAPNLAEIG